MAKKKHQEMRRHFSHFDIAGFTYYDGCCVFSQLKIGTPLSLEREKDNKHDADAIAIYFGDSKLGFVPATENTKLANFIDMGYADIFEARVQHLDPEAHMEHQVGVQVSILRNANYREDE